MVHDDTAGALCAGGYLKRSKHFCGDRLEVLLTAEDLLQGHKDCRGLNGTVHLGYGVVLQLFASKRQPGTYTQTDAPFAAPDTSVSDNKK